MTSSYQERQEAKRERLTAKAAKLHAEGEASAREGFDFFHQLNGQPMLPGHHSYRADVNRRAKHDAKIRRGYEKQDHAAELNRRAGAVGTGGIASDDPEATKQLNAKLDYINQERDLIKKVNRIARKHAPKLRPGNDYDPETLAKDLEDAGITPDLVQAAIKPDYMGRVGIETYVLENRTAEARRISKRIAALEAMQQATAEPVEWSGDGWEMWADTDQGRIFLEIEGGRLTRDSFTGIRSAGGFNWSRRDERFVRKITPNALRAAARTADTLADLIEFE